ncbi:hypothetical protein MBLNU230_g5665t1 [Neophaeotheca triangularis]
MDVSESEHPIGDFVPSHFNAGLVATSYIASLVGCFLTVELLNRRGTALSSFRSWAETLACATSMGLIGIWCMHFIGNRAIILGQGQNEYQLVYNSGYTTLSLFLPIIGLTMAFSVAELPVRSIILRFSALACTGVFAGLSVVGMHYIGNFGISNYQLVYGKRYLAASIIIAIGDCLTVLMLFYNWREKWINAWWKRMACAALLAGGVSAMHFTASVGCQYKLRGLNDPGAIHGRNVQVAVAGGLVGGAAVVVLIVLLISRQRAIAMRQRSQKIMLACAMFDPDGRVMVTTEGVLPSRQITDKYNHRSFAEDFDTAHPVFHWVYRVSRNWAGVSDLLPKMKSHLYARQGEDMTESRPTSSASSTMYEAETYSDYSVIFRESFCTAASSLASVMHVPIDKLGILYDRIVETGTIGPEDRIQKRSTVSAEEVTNDVEMGVQVAALGKGKLLFLVRRLSSEESDKLLNAGFRFASAHHVTRTIAHSMQVPPNVLEWHLTALKRFVDDNRKAPKGGTYLNLFAMIGKPHNRGFDIAVQKENQDLLPGFQIASGEPKNWQVDFLKQMDGSRTPTCQEFLHNICVEKKSPSEGNFAEDVLRAIEELKLRVPNEWFKEARFYAKPMHANYSLPSHSNAVATTSFCFTVLADMHASLETCNDIIRVPLSFYNARQRCYYGSPDHSVLTREIHQEFGPLLARKVASKASSNKLKNVRVTANPVHSNPFRKYRNRGSGESSSQELSDSHSSIHELVEKPETVHKRSLDRGNDENIWGGILVNSETTVETNSKSDFTHGGPEGYRNGPGMGIQVAVGTDKQEETFVDMLFAITKARFMPAKVSH